MDSRNANDNTEEEVKVNEISTESPWVIKKKNNKRKGWRGPRKFWYCAIFD